MARKFWWFHIAAAALALVTLLRFLDGILSFGDRLSHFTAYWALCALCLLALAVAARRWKLTAVCAVLAIVNGAPVLRFWLPKGRNVVESGGSTEFTVVSSNLYASNQRKPEALAQLIRMSPDVLVIMELGREWRRTLKPLLEKYPHHAGTGGTIWLLSRHPIRMSSSGEIVTTGRPGSSPFVEATIVLPVSAIRIVGVHATRPTGSEGVAQQRRQAGDYVRSLQRDPNAEHRMLVGDLNTSPFSSVFHHLVQTTGLRDAAKGWGYQPTWGPRLPREPLLPWLGIPIDHALVSDRVVVENRRVGEMPGSDHRYQLIKLRF